MASSGLVRCSGPDCDRTAFRGDLCRGHYKQRRQGRPLMPLRPRRQTKTARLDAAALAFAEAESEADFDRAKARLRVAGLPPARCVVEACGRRRYALGLCHGHWRASVEAFRRAHE